MLEQTYSSSFEVQQVVDQKIIDGQTHFLIKWVGYDHSENTWQPLRHMTHSKDKIKEWENYKISQLNLLTQKKNLEQLDIGPQKNKFTKKDQQRFKNLSNPYKKVFPRIQQKDDIQIEETKNQRNKIHNIFDQPQLKKIIKSKKSQRKKKQLQIFQKRLKSRPKIWEKYLENKQEVIEKANQKIKEVIDKAFANTKINSQNQFKQIHQTRKDQEYLKINHLSPYTKERISQQKFIPTQGQKIDSIKYNSNLKVIKINQKKVQNVQQQTQKLTFNQPNCILKKDARTGPSITKNKRTIFSQSEDEQRQKNKFYEKKKYFQNLKNKQNNSNLEKNLPFQKYKIKQIESQSEQETNFITKKQMQFLENKKNKGLNFKNRIQEEKKQCEHQKTKKIQIQKRNIPVIEIIRGIVSQSKEKQVLLKQVNPKTERNNLKIEPETILLTQSMLRNIRDRRLQNKAEKNLFNVGHQMLKISEESCKDSFSTKKSQFLQYIDHNLAQIGKQSQIPLKNIIVQPIKESQVKVGHLKQRKKNLSFVQNIILDSPAVNLERNEKCETQSFNHKHKLSQLFPFQCSASTIEQIIPKGLRENHEISQDELKTFLKKQWKSFDHNSFLSSGQFQNQTKSDKFVGDSSDQSFQLNVSENNRRAINYSSFTNHVSTTVPEQSLHSMNNRIRANDFFMNFRRQQSVSTRASERTSKQVTVQQNLIQNQENLSSQSVLQGDNYIQPLQQTENQEAKNHVTLREQIDQGNNFQVFNVVNENHMDQKQAAYKHCGWVVSQPQEKGNLGEKSIDFSLEEIKQVQHTFRSDYQKRYSTGILFDPLEEQPNNSLKVIKYSSPIQPIQIHDSFIHKDSFQNNPLIQSAQYQSKLQNTPNNMDCIHQSKLQNTQSLILKNQLSSLNQ